jgi:drug/metabolite transporter (DMT)-like permease
MRLLSFSERRSAIIACVAAVFLWGASFVATKIALASFQPLLLIVIRVSIGVFILSPFLLITDGLKLPSRKEVPVLFLLGIIGVGFYQWLQAVGVQLTSASQTSWLTASAPIFMVLMGWLFLREQIHGWQIAGLCLALVGDLLVAYNNGIYPMSFANLSGPLIIFAGALVWAGYSVLGKYLVKNIHPLRLSFFSLAIGLIFLLLVLVIGGRWELPEAVSTGEWVAVVFLGFGSTGLAYVFYFLALQGVEMTMVAAIQYLEPLITVLLASWLVAERMTVVSLVGGLFILVGVWLVNRFSLIQA